MITRIVSVDLIKPNNEVIKEAAMLILDGSLVAFPTETVYGLGANTLNPSAVKRIYEAKGRPSDNPLIAHVSSISMVERLVDYIDERAKLIMDKFWPGPLTIVLNKHKSISDEITSGLQTIAVRMPNHPVALALIDCADVPISAPSANLSGKPSPTRASHVYNDFKGKISLILDGGPVDIGLESTVLDLSGDIPAILRPGKITNEDLLPYLPNLNNFKDKKVNKPAAPGMKYVHYSPSGDVRVIPKGVNISAYISDISNKIELGSYALLLSDESADNCNCKPNYLYKLGSKNDLDNIAKNLFHSFRQCDKMNIDNIFIEEFPNIGIGEALMNRINKASVK